MRKRITLIVMCGMTLAAPCAQAGAAASPRPEEALHKAEAVLRGHDVKTGFEATPALKRLALRAPALRDGADRRRARRMLQRPGADGAPESTLCSAHFCIHWVTTGRDAPPLASTYGDGVPDYIRTMDAVFEHVRAAENGRLGWRAPRGDGSRGGGWDKVDVYVREVGDQGIFGWSTPDEGQDGNSQSAYLVMDNDYSHAEFPRYTDWVAPMEVTAAHEYNHVLQFAYDVYQDTWFMESTAVWMEDVVYDDVNDYVAYLASWSRMSHVPLTAFDELDSTDALNLKAYGDAVFPRWIQARYGAGLIRNAWERSTSTIPESFGPAAYDAALHGHGTAFSQAFARFAADTAEWRSSAGTFGDRDGTSWPDLARASARPLEPGARAADGDLDHTSYALFDVRPTADARIKLIGSLPHGTDGALALVGRVGPEATGPVRVALTRLHHGGAGTVTLAGPGRFSRITAVLVNADWDPAGFSRSTGQWAFVHDDEPVSARVSNRFAPLKLRAAKPAAGARVSPRSRVVLRFSAALSHSSLRSIRLRDAHGKRVRVRVKRGGDGRRVTLVPRHALSAGKRYRLELGSRIVDVDQNRLATPRHGWSFLTRS